MSCQAFTLLRQAYKLFLILALSTLFSSFPILPKPSASLSLTYRSHPEIPYTSHMGSSHSRPPRGYGEWGVTYRRHRTGDELVPPHRRSKAWWAKHPELKHWNRYGGFWHDKSKHGGSREHGSRHGGSKHGESKPGGSSHDGNRYGGSDRPSHHGEGDPRRIRSGQYGGIRTGLNSHRWRR